MEGRRSANENFVLIWFFVTLDRNYVNKADIKLHSPLNDKPQSADSAAREDARRWDIIELLFYAYRDFVGDADAVLEEFGFGRAHHRVMHFVQRYPGLTVADLLDVLRITKQSLGRVLKQLIDEDYIVQRAGPNDKRQRLLFATEKGKALVTKLAGLQTDRINAAIGDLDAAGVDTIRDFLRAMIDADNPDKVLQTVLDLKQTDKKEAK